SAGGELHGAWLRVEGGRIAALGTAPVAQPERGEEVVDLGASVVVPGLVDLHVHGGGGASYTTGDPAEAARAVAFHRRNGTTRTLASLVTAPLADLLAATSALAEVAKDGLIEGVHLEGPFLAPARCGAQDPHFLLAPDPEVLRLLLEAGRGSVRMITVAPELPGAVELIRRIVDAGVVAAIGHSDADYDTARAAIVAGARVATHLWNGMRPLHHRDPGIVGAALEEERVVCELIADGYHVHSSALALSFRAAAGRIALVTDAISAAGATDGCYRLGPALVRVEQGEARLDGSDTIAGSTITMAAGLRHAVLAGAVDLATASRAASAVPARLLGLEGETGSLAVGKAADLVALDADLHPVAVMRSGEWWCLDLPAAAGAG
ncbi:MAG TPA: N-acetylglucosamine-6-phosphate deacetylase, partial [Acidimicrobiales bacterium]|nr:N-acetylglucosamine-6-phosphate deacetylase [Acidimicrobiales bacterium]